MVNNFKQISDFLTWNSKDDFYFLQVLQRKKDAEAGMKVNGTNNNSRLIKAYFVKSKESLKFFEPEIIQLCKVFNARAGINLNKSSFQKLAIPFQRLILDNMENGNVDKLYKTYTSVVGKKNHDKNKKWIIDIDEEEMHMVEAMKQFINTLQPYSDEVPNKILLEIPSKTGLHLITSPFNLQQFKVGFPTIDVQKNNPTNCFIP
jgi:hypothetical protein